MSKAPSKGIHDNLALVLDAHLDAHFTDSPSGVRDAARDALQRRWTNMLAGQLVVVAAPARWGHGRYQVEASSGTRAYTLLLRGLSPLDISCDCADYRSGGLGVCKHALTVLRELADDVGAFDTLVAKGRRAAPVRWSPIWSPARASDWLDGVQLERDAIPGPRSRAFIDQDHGSVGVDTSTLRTARARDALCEQLATLNAGRHADPALSAWLRYEAQASEREALLLRARRGVSRALRRFSAQLRPYQRHAVERFLARGRLLLADDMGLGKTVQAAAIAHTLLVTGVAERILVIAPASLKAQWSAEWARFVPAELGEAQGVPGSARQRNALYDETSRGVLVANYEQVHLDVDAIARFAPQLVIFPLREGAAPAALGSESPLRSRC